MSDNIRYVEWEPADPDWLKQAIKDRKKAVADRNALEKERQDVAIDNAFGRTFGFGPKEKEP